MTNVLCKFNLYMLFFKKQQQIQIAFATAFAVALVLIQNLQQNVVRKPKCKKSRQMEVFSFGFKNEFAFFFLGFQIHHILYPEEVIFSSCTINVCTFETRVSLFKTCV